MITKFSPNSYKKNIILSLNFQVKHLIFEGRVEKRVSNPVQVIHIIGIIKGMVDRIAPLDRCCGRRRSSAALRQQLLGGLAFFGHQTVPRRFLLLAGCGHGSDVQLVDHVLPAYLGRRLAFHFRSFARLSTVDLFNLLVELEELVVLEELLFFQEAVIVKGVRRKTGLEHIDLRV